MKKTLFTSLAFAATALIMMATSAQAFDPNSLSPGNVIKGGTILKGLPVIPPAGTRPFAVFDPNAQCLIDEFDIIPGVPTIGNNALGGGAVIYNCLKSGQWQGWQKLNDSFTITDNGNKGSPGFAAPTTGKGIFTEYMIGAPSLYAPLTAKPAVTVNGTTIVSKRDFQCATLPGGFAGLAGSVTKKILGVTVTLPPAAPALGVPPGYMPDAQGIPMIVLAQPSGTITWNANDLGGRFLTPVYMAPHGPANGFLTCLPIP